ncbi:MAG: hypothetical protein U0003_03800 [Vampirovibrionales bacterium]
MGTAWASVAQVLHSPALAMWMMVGVGCAIASTMDSSLNVATLTWTHDLMGHGWPVLRQKILGSRFLTVKPLSFLANRCRSAGWPPGLLVIPPCLL